MVNGAKEERMQIKHPALWASAIWVIGSGLLAFWNQTWVAAWRLYCTFTADPTCADDTVFIVAHREVVAVIVIFPLVLAWLVGCGLIALRRIWPSA
jgi:hypothetical protein